MPIKSEVEHLHIPKKLKRSVKLTEEQKKEIVFLYNSGSISQRKLAKLFDVSRRLIFFILNPDKYEKYKIAYKEKGGSMRYYNKDKQRTYSQRTRAYRKELENKLIKKED